MRCDYFDAGVCRSCRWLGTPYAVQLRHKQERVAGVLAAAVPQAAWLPAVPSREEGFRNKAKMVVAGTADEPTLGILDPRGRGVDLRECGLHSPGLRAALPALADLVREARLTPYSVPERRGELKHVLVTESPEGELMVRFVLRSTEALPRLRRRLPELRATLPQAVVVSANLQPEHKAVLEGPEELLLTEQQTLTMRVNGLPLHLRPQSFFQTNTDVAAALYRHARDLVAEADPASVWDLYCGVGGFALHVADGRREVFGVETSAEAVASAETTRDELGVERLGFRAADAAAYALGAGAAPELVVVNPPRRGIGTDLADWLEGSAARHVVYSSCNADSLARDLARMPSLRPVSARLLDMFPHTDHHEVLVLLSRE